MAEWSEGASPVTTWSEHSLAAASWNPITILKRKWTPQPPALAEAPDQTFTLSRMSSAIRSSTKSTSYQGSWYVVYTLTAGDATGKITPDGWEWTASDGQSGEITSGTTIYNPLILAPGTAPSVTATPYTTNGVTKTYGTPVAIGTASLAGLSPQSFSTITLSGEMIADTVSLTWNAQDSDLWEITRNGAAHDSVVGSATSYSDPGNIGTYSWRIKGTRQNVYGTVTRQSNILSLTGVA